MRIKVIDPNTTASMTETITAAARAAASPGTTIVAATSPTGPASIEGHYDEALSVVGLLEEVRAGERDGCDGYVIACFGDPGLLAAREAARGPVLGIAEAAMHPASFVSTGFSVVTTLGRTRIIAEHLLGSYGMERHCRGVRSTELAVLDLADSASDARARILAECRRALDQDGSGAIVLGCAGMADLAADLTRDLGVPVIDGVGVAVRFVEALCGIGIRTSKRGDLAEPIAKPFTGGLSGMAWRR